MNNLFSRLTEQNTPAVNANVMNGLACLYMTKVEDYIHQVFLSASKSLPEGLEYVGFERCTPQEEFEEVTKIKNNKRVYDLAKSDLYLVKYKFTYLGLPIADRFIYLPYVTEGGIFHLGGTPYHITPVLSDKVISPGHDNVFVRLLRDKIIFKRTYHTVILDGMRETPQIIWSRIYRKPNDNKKVPITTKAETSVAHYLFAKYGVSETFRKYAGFTPIFGEDEITEELYPKEDWVICESSHEIAPKTYIGLDYRRTRIKLVIPRHKYSLIAQGLAVGLFYVVDHFPERFRADASYMDNTSLWMILLGHIVFSGLYGENKLFKSIEEHFVSLDACVDNIIIEKLKENNRHIENFYDLLAMILSDFNGMILDSENNSLSMYGKSLEVLYYVLYDITSGIFKANFRLSKLASKRTLQPKDITETFNKNIKMGAIFGLSSGKIITESVSYSGDHKYFKITSKITEQESLPGANRGKSKRMSVGEDKHLDISMVEAGSILFLSKSNPTPTNRLNCFVNIDLPTGTIVPNPELREVLEKTRLMLTGKLRA